SIGDTLWFKAYLLDKVNLTGSKMSGLLYVELDSDSSEMVRRISIPIKEGLGWGQIPLPKAIFREGSYTLRAYTNWMQNFGEDYVFSQQLYIGAPSEETWLVRSTASLNRIADKNQLHADIKLSRPDKLSSPVALKKVEVKIFDEWHYIYKEEMQTGLDGSLKLSQALKDNAEANEVRVQIMSLEKDTYGKILQIPLKLNRSQNTDLQFLPEGGNLVTGLKSTVGFKAVGEDGKGTPVLGGIFDGNGNEIVSFTATHNGMGSFEFTPKAGQTYIAKMLKPVAKVLAYPKINKVGTVMHINNPEQGENLEINLSGLDKLSTDTAYYLIGTSRGVVYYSQKMEFNKPDLAITKNIFPSGIARFTLFKGKTPLNERAVFIDNKDHLNIYIIPNKTSYNKRDSVGLEIAVKDKNGFPVKGSFSVAVTDDSQVRVDSLGDYNIGTSLLLNADLKGHVENPGYYLNRKDKQAWEHLDNLMLTQGWTGYDWKDVFAPDKPQPKFEIEKEFKVTGVVTNLSKKPQPNLQVIISSQKPSFVASAITDVNGRYEFKNLPAIDSGSFFLQANNDKGKAKAFGNITVEKFKASKVPENVHRSLPWYINTDTTQLNYIKQRIENSKERELKLTGHVLKEVKIKSRKVIPGSFNRNGDDRVDLSFDEEDIKESAVMNLYQLLKQKLPGLKVVDEKGLPTLVYNKHMVVIHIDGGGLPIMLGANPGVEELEEELSKFQIAQFKGMEVMYSEKNMVRYLMQRSFWINPHFKGDVMARSADSLKTGYWEDDGDRAYGIIPWIYAPGYRPSYLEARVNVKTNNPPDIMAIDITTHAGNGWYRNRAPGVVTYRPLPVMRPQQFYSPKYNVASTIIEPDFRSTLYWAPDVTTDQNGKAKVSFYTSDNKGKFTIKVAGVDAGGGIGDATTKINTNNTMP
ncbi:MAG: carboxypeptidase-like regulatory domain-containing protein, partial [Bacteroidota bacterium]